MVEDTTTAAPSSGTLTKTFYMRQGIDVDALIHEDKRHGTLHFFTDSFDASWRVLPDKMPEVLYRFCDDVAVPTESLAPCGKRHRDKTYRRLLCPACLAKAKELDASIPAWAS